jgi:PKD domain
MMSAVQLRLGRVFAGLLVLLLGPALLPASAASAASGAPTRVRAASSTQLSGFDTSRTSVRVGGAVWDNVTVLPRSARTVAVQYRRAGAARYTTASTGRSSAGGLFAARMRPLSAGLWKFRLVVAAAPGADRMVSPVRTIRASGKAASVTLRGFRSTPVTTAVGQAVVDSVTVLPSAHRTVRVQARRPGTRDFSTVSTGSSSSAGVYRAVYRPTSDGVWVYRLLVRASTTSRRAVSPARIVTVTTPTSTPTPTPTSTPSPTTTPTPTDSAPGPVTGLHLVSTTSSSITLSWTNPTAPDFAGVMIRRAVGTTPPASPTDGSLVAKTAANTTSFTDSGLASERDFTYTLFAFDTAANLSSRATGSATTGAPTTAVLTINGSTAPTAKLTQGESQSFVLSGSAGLGLSGLINGTLNYGDGQSQTFTGDPATWSPDAHAYAYLGSGAVPASWPVTATWRVIDSAFGSDVTTIDITVFKDEPTAKIVDITPNGNATVGVAVTFDVTGSGTPPGTDTSYDLYSVNLDGVSYATGSVFAAAGMPTHPTLTFDQPGKYDVTLVVDNDAGGEATDTTKVTVK